MSSSSGGISSYINSASVIIAVAAIAATAAIVVPTVTGGSGGGCNATVSSSSALTSAISAASAGQTICLNTADYGTWTGASKALTLKAASGQSPTIKLDVESGGGSDSTHRLVLDGMANVKASGISGTTAHFQIKNSTFTEPESLGIDGSDGATDIIVGPNDHFDFDFTTTDENGPNSKLEIDNPTGTITSPAVLVENSTFTNSDLDGIDIGGDNGGTGSSGVVIVNNVISQICQSGVNHTDYVQVDAASPGYTNSLFAGNLVLGGAGCGTQAITSFDAGTCDVTYTDNVIDVQGYSDGIVLQGDGNCSSTQISNGFHGSDVTHNTLIFYPTGSTGNLCHDTGDGGRGCGQVKLDTKPADPPGNHTRIFNNVVTYVDANTSDLDPTNPYTEGYNLCKTACDGGTGAHDIHGVGTLVGGSTSDGDTSGFTSFGDYALTSGSPGYHAASDGLSMGITGVYVP